MPYQEELREKQVLAIWVGDIETDGDMTEYLGTPFEMDFGFLLDYEDLPEVSRVYSEPRLHAHYNRPYIKSQISELLNAFTGSEAWAQEATRLCREKGFDQAKAVVVFPSLRYPEELCRNPNAPLRFIGNLPWPGGAQAWAALESKRLVMPPLPRLVLHDYGEGDELFCWEGIVHLDSWTGFATYAEISSDGWTPSRGVLPDGDFQMSIEPVEKNKATRPTVEQARAYEILLKNQRELLDSMLQSIFKIYPTWRENYYGGKFSDDGGKTWKTGWELPEMFPPEDMPEVKSPTDLLKLIRPGGPGIGVRAKDGVAEIRVHFNCKWDEEHGFAVLIHGGKDIEVGDSDLGI